MSGDALSDALHQFQPGDWVVTYVVLVLVVVYLLWVVWRSEAR